MNDIVKYEATPIDTERLGDIMVKSGFFKDVKDQAQAIVKMLYGGELGYGPIASMMGVYVVEGRPSMSAQLIAASVQKSGIFSYRVREWTDTICRIEFFERGESVGFAEFSIKDAERAKLAGRANWSTFPKAMLWARAMSQGARAYCPSIFNGAIYSVEELHDGVTVTDIETGEVTVVEAPTPQSEEQDWVRNADDQLWKNWLRVLAKAQGLGLNPKQVVLPMLRGDLRAHAEPVLLDIQEREKVLARQDAERAAAAA